MVLFVYLIVQFAISEDLSILDFVLSGGTRVQYATVDRAISIVMCFCLNMHADKYINSSLPIQYFIYNETYPKTIQDTVVPTNA